MGALYRQGWRPKRTIVYASWDGEEPGLLGSTEWAETHADELKHKALLYINSDNNGRGFLERRGQPRPSSISSTQVADDVLDPQTGVPVRSARPRATSSPTTTPSRTTSAPSVVAAAQVGGDLPMGPLGSGSDYSRLRSSTSACRRSTSASAARTSRGGSYHSAYDSLRPRHPLRRSGPALWRRAVEGRRPARHARRRRAAHPGALLRFRQRRCRATSTR